MDLNSILLEGRITAVGKAAGQTGKVREELDGKDVVCTLSNRRGEEKTTFTLRVPIETRTYARMLFRTWCMSIQEGMRVRVVGILAKDKDVDVHAYVEHIEFMDAKLDAVAAVVKERAEDARRGDASAVLTTDAEGEKLIIHCKDQEVFGDGPSYTVKGEPLIRLKQEAELLDEHGITFFDYAAAVGDVWAAW